MYHSKKTEKVKVVVYCSAQFQGMSLNSELLQSTNLTNVQFGWNSVSFLTRPSGCNGIDVQSIFHQVRVPVEDRDFMRFLWCRPVVISIRVRKSTE